MSIEANKALARRFIDEIANRGNLAIADELFAPDFETRDAVVPTAPGSGGVKQVFRAVLAAFPDFHETVEDVLADEDRVMVRWSTRGTPPGAVRRYHADRQGSRMARRVYPAREGRAVRGDVTGARHARPAAATRRDRRATSGRLGPAHRRRHAALRTVRRQMSAHARCMKASAEALAQPLQISLLCRPGSGRPASCIEMATSAAGQQPLAGG